MYAEAPPFRPTSAQRCEATLAAYGYLPFTEVLPEVPEDELLDLLRGENRSLGELGVTTPIMEILGAAQQYGTGYEDRRNDHGLVMATPLNCLMAILRAQPDLLSSGIDTVHGLAQTAARVSSLGEELLNRSRRQSIYYPEFATAPPPPQPPSVVILSKGPTC